ncbi:MAG TPA: hypothetical protein DF783_05690 [Acidimicrobiaceae bacterium]|nr:hypothetical protein [Acidimicrobiaceae bacterium]HCV36401.1 hypothetical protein [Acidimicrobiaceae bacterium]
MTGAANRPLSVRHDQIGPQKDIPTDCVGRLLTPWPVVSGQQSQHVSTGLLNESRYLTSQSGTQMSK